MSNIARRSEEWHLNRDWTVILVAVVLVAAVKLGVAVPWERALPAQLAEGGEFRPTYALAGLMVGFLVGLTGMGSGALMAPVLIFLLHVKPSLAVGSDLIYASITKAFGAYQHYKHGTVDLALTRWLATGSVPGALIGSQAVEWFRARYGESVEAMILTILGGAFVLVSTSIVVRTFLPRKDGFTQSGSEFSSARKAATVVLGLAVGILVGITSVGSGSLLMTVLILFYAVSTTRLVGTDIFHAVLLTAAAGASHFLSGNVDMVLVCNLLIGSVPGIVLGSRLVPVAPERLLRVVLAVVLFLTGLKMLT
ncbi:MAG: sulfite exporter TauE/SafE family protein [Chloroflexota bacterium]|nr:sulfite exporter TauE/SafE family protein [Chloroflexota bacterium]